jgi:hypothetical protein
MNRGAERDVGLRAANMTSGAALARDWATTYLGQRGKLSKLLKSGQIS